MTEHSYTVIGMTCEHCVRSVREEVSELAGVTAVEIDLPSGHVRVVGDQVSEASVRTAVAAAGYEVAA